VIAHWSIEALKYSRDRTRLVPVARSPDEWPDLAPWPDADAILGAALALPAADRRAFVEARTTDPALRAALFPILDEATADDGFVDAISGDGAQLIAEWRQQADGAPARTSGEILGAYRIIDSLGVRRGLASLNHSHVGAIYTVVEDEQRRAGAGAGRGADAGRNPAPDRRSDARTCPRAWLRAEIGR
jgi:hypothetical protein